MAGSEWFVGRRAELDLLRARLAAATHGSGGVVMVSGPAGIGKTRLILEFLGGADATPAGWGAAVADVGMPALWPWTRALRGWSATQAAMASLVAGDAHRDYSSADDAAAATFAADTAVVDALEEQARAAGALIVVLDDLHWADRATLRLLERLAAEVRRLPVLVIGTHREPIELRRSGAIEEVALEPLDVDDARRLLASTVDRADPAAVNRAAEMAGGSPLFIRTLGRVAGAQLRGDRPWDGTVGSAPEFRNLIAGALRSVGPDVADAVEALSVLGTEIADMDLFAEIIGVDRAAAIDLLRPAVAAGLVEIGRTPSYEVRFAHALVRDAAYASLQPSRCAQLHRRAAQLLEPLATGRDDRAGAVARHWSRAGEPALAIPWAVRAAGAAKAAGAYDQAASYVELALTAANRDGTGSGFDRAELTLDLARMQYLGGHIGPSVQSCLVAADEGEQAGRPDVVARAAIVVQGLGDPDVNMHIAKLCRRALAMLDRGTMTELTATVEAQLACALNELGAIDESEQWSRQSLDDASASGDPDAELDAIRARAMLLWRSADNEDLYALGGRAIQLAERTRRPLARLWAHTWRSDVAYRRADMADVRREILGMQELANSTGLPLARWHLLRRQASLAAQTGDFDTCRRLGREGDEMARSWQDASVRYTHLAQTVCLALRRGDPADIDPQWMERLAGIEDQPPIARAVIAAALWLVGRTDEAHVMYEPLVPILTAARTPLEAAATAYVPDLAVAFGDVGSCLAIRDWLVTNYSGAPAVGSGTVFYYGSVARMLGRLELAANQPAAAIAHFEEGLSVDRALGARPYLAEGRLGLAQALRATGETARVVELARAAAAEARRLDMPGLLRAADTFLAGTAATARAADPLTSREREVLSLVAEAKSNREIAQTLVLSERTIESHVRNILAKAGLTSRTELVRWHLQRNT